jgi:Heavy metal associated domain 2
METKGVKVVHALPGRVRLRVSKVRGNPALARRAEKKLAQVPGIKQVEAKADTGSLLIHYNMEDLCAEASLEILQSSLGELFPEIDAVGLMAGLACLAEPPGAGPGLPLAEGITGTLSALNTRVSKLTGGLDLKLIAPLALIALGLRGMWQSEKVAGPSWSNLLWFGFASFVMLNRHLVEGTAGTAAEKKPSHSKRLVKG